MSRFVSRMELARRARSGVKEVRALLLRPTPQAVRDCAAHLEEAIATVRNLEGELGQPGVESPQALRSEVAELRQELDQARALLDQAFRAHAGWYHLLSGMLGGYSREGTPTPAQPACRWAIEG